MPVAKINHADFQSESWYHIILKSIDGIQLFYDESDYLVFQDRFKKFTRHWLETAVYCLITNHTHFLCKIKSIEDIHQGVTTIHPTKRTQIAKNWLQDMNNPTLLNFMILRQFNSFLSSYALYINEKFDRKGGLFQHQFVRKLASDTDYLRQLVLYIHGNPIKHGLAKDFRSYTYSSYPQLINPFSHTSTSTEIIRLFGGIKQFDAAHQQLLPYFYQTDPVSVLRNVSNRFN